MISLDVPATRMVHPDKSHWTTWPFKSLEEAERAHIIDALKQCNGQVRGRGGAAELLQINPSTLVSRLSKLAIKPKQYVS